jgi:hypothetical protein
MQAQINAANNVLPLRPGVNYAPLEPFLELRDKKKEISHHYLTDAIIERYQDCMAQHQETWQDLISVGHLTTLFIQGKQNLKFNSLANTYFSVPVNQRNSEKFKVTPIMRFYQQNWESRYMSSNPRIKVAPGREDDRCAQAAKAAQTVSEHFAKKFYTARFNRDEIMELCGFGTRVNQIKWNAGVKGFKAFREIFEDHNFTVNAGAGQCFEPACAYKGTGAEFFARDKSIAACPKCNSFNVYAEPPVEQSIPVLSGKEEINLGAPVLRGLAFPSNRWDLRFTAEESSWFIHEEFAPLGALQLLVGDVMLPDSILGNVESGHNFGLDCIESLARMGIAIGGKTNAFGSDEAEAASSLYREKVKITEFSMSPEDYADVKIEGDEQTIGGVKLPRGARLVDFAPEGAVAVIVNGSMLWGFYPEKGGAAHKKELSTGVMFNRQYSGAGQGMADTVELQKRLNETDSQGYAAMRHQATPAVFYPEGAIGKAYLQYIGKPDVAVPINFSSLPQTLQIRSIQDIISSPRVGAIDTGILMFYQQNLRDMMGITSGNTYQNGAMAGVKNTTATGARISDANQESLFLPMLQSKGDVRVREAELLVAQYKVFVPVAQYFPLSGKFGAQQGVWLSGADLDNDVSFEIVKDSELPRNRYTMRDDIDRFFLTVGGAAGLDNLMKTNPKFANELVDKYGLDFEINSYDEVEQICRQRYEAAKKIMNEYRRIQAQAAEQLARLHSQMPADDSAITLQPDATGSYSMPPETETLNGEMSPPAPAQQFSAPTPQDMGQNTLPQGMSQFSASPTQTNGPAALSAPNPANAASAMLPPMSPTEAQAEMIVSMVRPKISAYEPNLMQKGEFFSEFLDSDEGRTLDDEMHEVVIALARRHFQAEIEKQSVMAQMQGAVALAGTMPGQIADTVRQQYLAEQSAAK